MPSTGEAVIGAIAEPKTTGLLSPSRRALNDISGADSKEFETPFVDV